MCAFRSINKQMDKEIDKQIENRVIQLIEDYKTLRFAGEPLELEKYLAAHSVEEATFIREQIQAWEWFEELKGSFKKLELRQPVSDQLSQLNARLAGLQSEETEVQDAISRLQKQRQQIGFTPQAFSKHIELLAKAVGISLAPVLKWFGITDLSRIEKENISTFAQFSRELGLSLDEMLIHLRIGFAEQLGHSVPVHGVRYRMSGTLQNQFIFFQMMLEDLESKYDAETREMLYSIESEVREAYQSNKKPVA